MYFDNPLDFDNPLEGVKVETEWTDIWVSYISVLLSSGTMWILHLHYLPDTEEVRWKIYNQLRPFWKFRKAYSVNEGYEMLFQFNRHGDYGCIISLWIDAKDIEGLFVQEKKGESRQELKAFLEKAFPTAKVI